ncbi:hypothetical protein L1887_42465 [Cichorium endivia]|nr:hypothetical protein L1887_42465 [Cichorium endivia]
MLPLPRRSSDRSHPRRNKVPAPTPSHSAQDRRCRRLQDRLRLSDPRPSRRDKSRLRRHQGLTPLTTITHKAVSRHSVRPSPRRPWAFDRGGFHSPRNSSSHFDPHQSPAPLPALQTQSPHTFSHPPSARPDVNRRASGGAYGPGAYQAPFGAPSPQAHFAPADRPQPRIESSHRRYRPPTGQHTPKVARTLTGISRLRSSIRRRVRKRIRTRRKSPTQATRSMTTRPAQAGVRAASHSGLCTARSAARQRRRTTAGAWAPSVCICKRVSGAESSSGRSRRSKRRAGATGPLHLDRRASTCSTTKDSALGLSDIRGQANGIASAGGADVGWLVGTTAAAAGPSTRNCWRCTSACTSRSTSDLSRSRQRCKPPTSGSRCFRAIWTAGCPPSRTKCRASRRCETCARSQATGCRGSVDEITESVRSIHARDDPDPDSMVLATSIVGNQLGRSGRRGQRYRGHALSFGQGAQCRAHRPRSIPQADQDARQGAVHEARPGAQDQ